MGMRNSRCLKYAAFYFALLGATAGWLWFDRTQVACAKPPEANSSASEGSGGSASASSSSGAATVEANRPAERRAAKLANEATGADYKAGHHAAAEKKLRSAIQICMMQTCSDPFKARLHRDLGFIYAAGLKRVEDGKDEFTAALTADSTVILTADMEDSQPAKQAFDEVKASMTGSQSSTKASDADVAAKAESKADEDPKKTEAKDDSKKSSESNSQKSDSERVDVPPAPVEPKTFLNWLSLAVEQDLVLHSATKNACSAGSPYKCFWGDGRYDTVSGARPGGNQVAGGLTSGPWRVLVGYDRVLLRRITLGARLGAMVAGKAERAPGERAIMLFHGEARAAAWLGHEPFAETGLHPYLFLSGGVAEADGTVLVHYSIPGDKNCDVDCKLNAWKRSGPGFVGAGAGLQFSITPRMGPRLEARYMQFLGPAIPVVGLQLGYALGF